MITNAARSLVPFVLRSLSTFFCTNFILPATRSRSSSKRSIILSVYPTAFDSVLGHCSPFQIKLNHRTV